MGRHQKKAQGHGLWLGGRSPVDAFTVLGESLPPGVQQEGAKPPPRIFGLGRPPIKTQGSIRIVPSAHDSEPSSILQERTCDDTTYESFWQNATEAYETIPVSEIVGPAGS